MKIYRSGNATKQPMTTNHADYVQTGGFRPYLGTCHSKLIHTMTSAVIAMELAPWGYSIHQSS